MADSGDPTARAVTAGVLLFLGAMEIQDQSPARSRITIDPALCNGKPTIRGKRITVQTVLEFLSAGESREEILRQYPSLEPEDIDASLAFAAEMMGHNYVIKMIA